MQKDVLPSHLALWPYHMEVGKKRSSMRISKCPNQPSAIFAMILAWFHRLKRFIAFWLALIVVLSAAVPSNDDCDYAIPLRASSSSVVVGSTIDASVDGLNLCGENLVQSPGVWFLYQSTDNSVVHVSTCSSETNFDTALTVFGGQCSSLTCVDGRDDDLECDTDEHSTISWQALAGQQYFVLVHGSEQNHTGDFGLIVTESEPLPTTGTSSASATGGNMWMHLLFIASIEFWMLGLA